MSVRKEERGSDSPLVQRITRVSYGATVAEPSTPDGCWDIVILKKGGKVAVLQTGVITRPVLLENQAGDEYLSISFKPGVFMPALPGEKMVDQGEFRPLASPRRVWFERDALEIPTFDNADDFVARLVKLGALARDPVVEGVLEGRSLDVTPRSVQRHFLRTLGITSKYLEQIARARRAVELLQQRQPAVDVALELGYSDQSHLTHSLKRIMGQTPGEIVRALPPRIIAPDAAARRMTASNAGARVTGTGRPSAPLR